MDDIQLERRDDLAHLEALLAPILPQGKDSPETSLTIRLPQSLKESLKADAEIRGLNLSDSIRLKLSNLPLPPRHRSSAQMSGLDRGILVELNRIGTNLNQITRKLNSQKNSKANAGDRQTLTELLTLLQQIEQRLIDDPDTGEIEA